MFSTLVGGGGAAGYFAAITAKERDPARRVLLVDSGSKPLRKVEISGGGRCNVTHACFDSAQLVRAYPRGHKELHGPFSRFQPRDTVHWFESRGVKLKTEADGRIFPLTDSAKTIIDCLEHARLRAGAELAIKTKVEQITRTTSGFTVRLKNQQEHSEQRFSTVILTTGSAPGGYALAAALGHTIIPCVPSLFTFEIADEMLNGLSGVSMERTDLRLALLSGQEFSETGPLLITHWGFSGPAVIRLSAWAARPLAECRYQAKLFVNWIPALRFEQGLEEIRVQKEASPKQVVAAHPLFSIPKRLWANLVLSAGIESTEIWAHIRREQMDRLLRRLYKSEFQVENKGEFKEEFVTCGGVSLREVDFQTMESKLVPGLYFAGEILDIDGITGGFNFQSAWTTGWIAGQSVSA